MEGAIMKWLDRFGLTNKKNEIINPVEKEQLQVLQRIVKLMESQAVVDIGGRQRVAIDVQPNTIIGSGTLTTVSNVSNITTIAGQGNQQFADVARNAYANGIRSKLIFT